VITAARPASGTGILGGKCGAIVCGCGPQHDAHLVGSRRRRAAGGVDELAGSLAAGLLGTVRAGVEVPVEPDAVPDDPARAVLADRRLTVSARA
jgi:hypothetical protein